MTTKIYEVKVTTKKEVVELSQLWNKFDNAGVGIIKGEKVEEFMTELLTEDGVQP